MTSMYEVMRPASEPQDKEKWLMNFSKIKTLYYLYCTNFTCLYSRLFQNNNLKSKLSFIETEKSNWMSFSRAKKHIYVQGKRSH